MSIYIDGNPASGLPASYPSNRVTYDNTTSGLTATDVQGAIDELASDSGGHVIQNAAGTDLTQRGTMQFADAHITDNALDNKTEVEIAKEVTEADFDALNPQGTEHDGVYLMEVAGATPLTADMVGYGNGTVEDMLDAIPITVTEASGCTITNLTAYKCGRFTKISGRAIFDNAVGGGSSADIGNIPVEFAPQDTVVCVAINNYDLGAVLLNSSGLITFRHIVGSVGWLDNTFTFIY